MRNYQEEAEQRVEFIKTMLQQTGAKGIVYGNSGGKDCALVGILCKIACSNTVGIMMPCTSQRNYGQDMQDGLKVAEQFAIETKILDLTATKESLVAELEKTVVLNNQAITNIAPRLRMTGLYAIAAGENRLVAGTGNRSELYMGYFTKWGDGGCDFNVISDLTVTEVYEFLRFFNAPASIIAKPPSAGLFDQQTDEEEMGVTYQSIDQYIISGETTAQDQAIIDRYHARSQHKRELPVFYHRD